MPSVQIVYEIHVAVLDIEIQDRRRRGYRTASGRLRPFLTLVIFPQIGLVMASCLSADCPDWRTIAALLYTAITRADGQLQGGIPDEISVHKSAEVFVSHLQDFCSNLGVTLRLSTSEHPTQKEGERLIGRLMRMTDERLLAYMGVQPAWNRSESPTPTLQDLEDVFKQSLTDYHSSSNSETGQSPPTFWQKHCFPRRAVPHRLAVLLSRGVGRTIVSAGIRYGQQCYWDDQLAYFQPGTRVLIYPTPSLSIPRSVEVYHQNRWVCTAEHRGGECLGGGHAEIYPS